MGHPAPNATQAIMVQKQHEAQYNQLRLSIKDKQISKFAVAPTRAAVRPRAATAIGRYNKASLVTPRMSVSKLDLNDGINYPKAKAQEIFVPKDKGGPSAEALQSQEFQSQTVAKIQTLKKDGPGGGGQHNDRIPVKKLIAGASVAVYPLFIAAAFNMHAADTQNNFAIDDIQQKIQKGYFSEQKRFITIEKDMIRNTKMLYNKIFPSPAIMYENPIPPPPAPIEPGKDIKISGNKMLPLPEPTYSADQQPTPFMNPHM